ncbi:hypothetical protein AB1Y20_013707 [Prymnesium parvum]|uniref:Uncharacterized protein n=1 Tax=Prymnesium parvum TaxID=97485 RepID=A0AB34III8_PRYPA
MSLSSRASRISALRKLNDENCLAAQTACSSAHFDELAALLRDCSLVRHLNDVHLQAELDNLVHAARYASADPPGLGDDEEPAVHQPSATSPARRSQPSWLGSWSLPAGGFSAVLTRMRTLRKVLAALPRAQSGRPADARLAASCVQTWAPLSDFRLYLPTDRHPRLDAAVGFHLLQLRRPATCEAVVRLLLASLFHAEVTPHAMPLVGWGLSRGSLSATAAATAVPSPPRLLPTEPSCVGLLSLFTRSDTLQTLFSDSQPPPRAELYPEEQPSKPRRIAAEQAGQSDELARCSEGSRCSNGSRSPTRRRVPLLPLHVVPSSATDFPSISREPLPPPPADAASGFGDFVLFAVAHTLAIAQDAFELQHSELELRSIALLPTDWLTYRGQPLSASPTLDYEWSGYKYSFRTPRVIPVLGGVPGAMLSASARLDGVLIDGPPPSFTPALTEQSDLHSFWQSARREGLPCGELVRRRLDALFERNVTFNIHTCDPWEQYRVGEAVRTPPRRGCSPRSVDAPAWSHPNNQSVHSTLDCEWFPPAEVGGGGWTERRDCSAALLASFPLDKIESLCERADAIANGAHADLDAGEAWLVGRAQKLEQVRATARAAAAAHGEARQNREREAAKSSLVLQELSSKRVDAACQKGFDGIGDLFIELLGSDVWERTVMQVPDDWDEDEALKNLADVLTKGAGSPHFWLLLPTIES